MKRLFILGLMSLALLNGCSKCTREEVPPPPPEMNSPEMNPAPDANQELPAEGEPATPAFPDGSQGGEGADGKAKPAPGTSGSGDDSVD